MKILRSISLASLVALGITFSSFAAEKENSQPSLHRFIILQEAATGTIKHINKHEHVITISNPQITFISEDNKIKQKAQKMPLKDFNALNRDFSNYHKSAMIVWDKGTVIAKIKKIELDDNKITLTASAIYEQESSITDVKNVKVFLLESQYKETECCAGN